MRKIKNKLLIILCIFVVIMPFWLVKGLCAEIEELTPTTASNLKISPSSNIFESVSTGSVSYIEMEVGYIYYITFDSDSVTSDRQIAISSDVPALNGVYTYLGSISNGNTFTYRPTQNSYFLCSYPTNVNAVTFTREKITSMDGAINDLVENVGANNLWSIFENAVQYIWVVVVAGFGFFIIRIIIKKLSKGKGGM